MPGQLMYSCTSLTCSTQLLPPVTRQYCQRQSFSTLTTPSGSASGYRAKCWTSTWHTGKRTWPTHQPYWHCPPIIHARLCKPITALVSLLCYLTHSLVPLHS